jgi:hypothetical protein
MPDEKRLFVPVATDKLLLPDSSADSAGDRLDSPDNEICSTV